MRASGKVLAFFIAWTVFLPYAYFGFVATQEVQAQEKVEEMVEKALPKALKSATFCSLGGWVTGMLKDFISWLGWADVVAVGSEAVLETGAGIYAHAGEVTVTAMADKSTTVPVLDWNALLQRDIIDQHTRSIMQNSEASKASNLQTAKETSHVTFWDCVLKPLMIAIRETVIRAMTDDILAWIRGGFEGQPAFLTNPKRFFGALAERAVSAFLYESGMDEYLCSPFRIDIIFSFMWNWQRAPHSQFGELSCSLDQIFSQGVDLNIGIQSVSSQAEEMRRARATFGSAYQSGSVQAASASGANGGGGGSGGSNSISYGLPSSYQVKQDKSGKWNVSRSDEEFRRVVTNGLVNTVSMGMTGLGMLGKSNNSAVYQYIRTGEEAMKKMGEAAAEEKSDLDQNNGWFSQRCDTDGDGELDVRCTPGSFIAKQVDQHTNSFLTQLTLADEFGEILDALLEAFIQKILDKAQGDYGLLHVSASADLGSAGGGTQATSGYSYETAFPPYTTYGPTATTNASGTVSTVSGTSTATSTRRQYSQEELDAMRRFDEM
jgi:hypothetical protein